MADPFYIRYLSSDEIDKTKWDKCISDATNGLVYGYSYYLNYMSKQWDALVLDDYEAVMPLTWNKKYGIYYLYQPAFTASLGVFGNNLTESLIEKFIQAIPGKFKLIEISLNHQNLLSSPPGFFISRTNYILPLNKSYHELYHQYRENHQRNIQKSIQAGCIVDKNVSVGKIMDLNKERMQKISPIAEKDYERFEKLFRFLFNENKAITYGIENQQNKLLSAAIFFFSHKRAYYIMAGNHAEGRNLGASHALIDAFIKDHAGKDIELDFEGSDIESLGMFYNGFGARKEIYPAIRRNRLPWYLRMIKS